MDTKFLKPAKGLLVRLEDASRHLLESGESIIMSDLLAQAPPARRRDRGQAAEADGGLTACSMSGAPITDRFIEGGMTHKEAIQWANARDHERAGVPLNPSAAPN